MSVATLRLGRWLRGGNAVDDTNDIPDDVTVTAWVHARRKRYEDIGDFLFVHDLEVSDRNFAVARAYLDGDRDVGRRIETLLRECGKLTDVALAPIAEDRSEAARPEKLAGMADQLNEKLVECLGIIGQSSAFARDYGAAIGSEAEGFAEDPLGTFERLLALTRNVVDGTLDLEVQLERAQKETQRLRSHLTRARREADHDHLTGLPNRRSFESRLAALPVTPDADAPGCIALCDIDRFKTINDEHGHDTGDRVLRYFARRLRDALAGRAVVARYGGEEFVCLFEATPITVAAAELDTIRASFEAKSLVNQATGRPMTPLTFSAGVAPIDGDPRHALIAADRALYEAKRAGRNRLVTKATSGGG